MTKRFLIVGAGFSGAVLARELAEHCDCIIDIIEQRDHIAGNCYTERDPETGVLVHKYGAHIFHTSRQDIWDYVNRFCTFGQYTNRVKAVTKKGVFSLPINLLTINQFFNQQLPPQEAAAFIQKLSDPSINVPQNFEEQALKFIGSDLYQAFFYGYTKKQWGCEPAELPASILKRLPVRFNYNDNYYNDIYQGIPVEGYTGLIKNILQHERISVRLNCSFERDMAKDYAHVFYTGPLDAYYNFEFGRLRYRSLEFQSERTEGDFQGNAVINYPELDVPFTRIIEHKHFAPWEDHKKTIYTREYSKAAGPNDIPYYPLRLKEDMTILERYRQSALNEKQTSFLGRMGTYRYLDMHIVIAEAYDFARTAAEAIHVEKSIPTFPEST